MKIFKSALHKWASILTKTRNKLRYIKKCCKKRMIKNVQGDKNGE